MNWTYFLEPGNVVYRSFMASGTGKIRICYGARPKIFGHEFNLVWFPQEVTYPFPTILFFRPRATTGDQLPADSKGYIMTGS